MDRKDDNRERVIASWHNSQRVCDGIPFVVFLELTRECNLHCPMCRTSFQKGQAQHMSTEVIDQVGNVLAPYAELIDIRGWGESLVRSDFVELVERIADWGAQLRIVTNATVHGEEKYEVLMRFGALVSVSIDASDDRILRRLRTTSTSHVRRGIQWLLKWREFYGVPEKNISAIVAIGRSNLLHIPTLLTDVHRWGISRFVLFPHICPRESPESLFPFSQEVRNCLLEISDLTERLDIECQLGAALHPEIRFRKNPVSCCHPWTHILINYDGRIGFCDHLNGRDEFMFGNIMNSDLRDLWNSKFLLDIRQSLLTGSPSLSPCVWCTHYRYIDFENLMPGLGNMKTTLVCKKNLATENLEENWIMKPTTFVRQTSQPSTEK